MEFGLFKNAVTSIYEGPFESKRTQNGWSSAIADEGLHGMGFAVTGEEEDGFFPIRTHYDYQGYLKKEDAFLCTLRDLKDWEHSDLMVVDADSADVTNIPKVQGICLITLIKGAIVELLAWEREDDGWAQVRLADGRLGYMRNQFLTEKKYSQRGLWEEKLPQREIADESQFRDNVVEEALKYCKTQYRWGGKSKLGIDCSGLTSMCYMLEGILIYRDATIENGFPVREIPMQQMKKGDLLYFPGHIALYMGDNRYIHSTGKAGSGGVVVNSLNPLDDDYREDLAIKLYAVGSIFSEC